MKYIPTRNQWKNWTLPSKASYIGVILAFVLFVAGILITLYLDSYVKESDQPKLSIGSQNKPYLRYEVIGTSKIEFSYELSFSNLGKNTAININYSYVRQKLSIANTVIVQVDNSVGGDKPPSKAGYRPPSKLISGDKYFQIFKLSGNDLKSNQLENLISNYNKGQLSIILDIYIEYDDAITHKKYTTNEILNIHKDKVLILNDET